MLMSKYMPIVTMSGSFHGVAHVSVTFSMCPASNAIARAKFRC